jgi:type I restriction enzyme S subunit
MLPERSVCVVCIGATIGKVCMTARPSFTNQQINSVVVNEQEHDPFFVYHLLITLRDTLKANAGGAATPIINKSAFSEIEVRVPALPVQRRIGRILSAYDDLIENNTRRIQILEQMAQALYREWFVNFRFPGHAKANLVASPLGQIPQGWAIRRLDQVVKVNASAIERGQEPRNILYVDISSVVPGRIERIEPIPFGDAPGRARRMVHHGDTIWSCVRPNRKSFSLILNPPPDLIVSTGFAVLTPTGVPPSFLHQAVTTDEFVGYLTNCATGAAYPAVTAKDFEAAEILVPDEPLLRRFHGRCEPMLLLKQNLLRRNVNLRRARDVLLPRLLSGKIIIGEG